MTEVLIARQAGQAVREARNRMRLTQTELARRAGVSTRLVSGLELGDNTGIGLDKLLSILHVLGLAMTICNRDTPDEANKSESSSEDEVRPHALEEERGEDPIARMRGRYRAALAQMREEATNDGWRRA